MIRDWQIRLDVQAAISRVKVEGEGADDEDMKLVLAYLLCLLAYRSWQTPGAVTNATLNEYEAMKEELALLMITSTYVNTRRRVVQEAS